MWEFCVISWPHYSWLRRTKLDIHLQEWLKKIWTRHMYTLHIYINIYVIYMYIYYTLHIYKINIYIINIYKCRRDIYIYIFYIYINLGYKRFKKSEKGWDTDNDKVCNLCGDMKTLLPLGRDKLRVNKRRVMRPQDMLSLTNCVVWKYKVFFSVHLAFMK